MRVSVIIPTFNRLNFLQEAVTSVIKQTYSDFELIIVDDGSTDGTLDFFQTYPEKPLRFITQNHQGVSSARNTGIKAAHGEWLAFLDSDDLWEPKKLEVQMDYLKKNPDVRMCQTEEMWIRNGVRVNPMKKHQKHSGWIFGHCVPLCIVSPSAVMIHREVFDRCGLFDETLPACEDYDLWLRVSLNYPIVTLPEKLVVKRGGHDDQLSRQWGLDRYRIVALKKILKNPLLTLEQKKLVEESIAFRSRIVEEGARKRHYETT